MAELKYDEEIFNAPIPGESMTVAPGQYPYDRPPQTSNAEEAVGKLFTAISKPKTMNKLLYPRGSGGYQNFFQKINLIKRIPKFNSIIV